MEENWDLHRLDTSMNDVAASQMDLCHRFSAEYLPCGMEMKVGISRNFNVANYPLNGLRHPPEGDTTGWYIWSGKEFSDDPDFFAALHAAHLLRMAPAIVRYLGLAPGWRFLLASGYEDVWKDGRLLDV